MQKKNNNNCNILSNIYSSIRKVVEIKASSAALKNHSLALSFTCIIFILTASSNVAHALSVRAIHLENSHGKEYISLQLSDPAKAKIFLVDNPHRLVIDLPPFIWDAQIKSLQEYEGSILSNVRYARFNESISRIVFDLTEPVTFVKHSKNDGSPSSSEIILTLTPVTPKQETTTKNEHVKTEFKKIPTPITKPSPLSSWKKPVVIVDAGHGGKDTGAIGRKGTLEKNITLQYAKELVKAFNETGRFEAKLTRSNDQFILLRERVKIARQAGANLFLSIHADSAPNIKARGLSIYTLSESASDKEAAALAERENKAGIINGFDLTHQNRDVANILIDLAQRDTKNKSITLADTIVNAMEGSVTLLPNTHRYAGFAVLTAPDIPSALIEIGFLSHPKEEKAIKRDSYRKKVIRGIIRGVDRYFTAQSKN